MRLFDLSLAPDTENYVEYALFFKRLVTRTVIIIGMPVLLFFSIPPLLQQRYVEGIAHLFMLLILCIILFVSAKFSRIEKEDLIYEFFQRFFIFTFAAYFIYVTGRADGISKIPWFYIFPVLVFFSVGLKEGLFWSSLLIMISAYFIFTVDYDISVASIFQLKTRFFLLLVLLSLVTFITSYIIRSTIENMFEKHHALKESEKRNLKAYETLAKETEERMAAQHQLQASEEKYRLHFENISDIVYSIDPEFRMLSISPSVERLTGYKPEELIGKPFYELGVLAPDYLKAAYLDIERVMSGKTVTASVYEFITKDGEKIIGEVSGAPLIRDGRTVAVVSVARDITERRMAEDALRKSEEQYRDLVENINEVIYTINENGEITYVSPRIQQDSGYRSAELVGRNISEFVHPEDLPQLLKHIEARLGGNLEPVEYRLLTKNGDARWMRSSSRPIYEENRFVGLRGVLTDITEQKRLEMQLRQAQKMEDIGTLAGGVAHDLNNILSGIVSYPDLLLMQIPKDSPLRDSILTIQQSGEKAAAIVQDLLTLARRGVPTTQVVCINDIALEFLHSPECEKVKPFHSGIEIKTHFKSDLMNIIGSPIHLSKTIMNLIMNAAEAIPEGGQIMISTENKYIDKPIRGYDDVHEGDYVVIQVEDNGIGISAEDLNKIFDPFYTKKVMGRSGTGLGMAVVWATVKDHHGYIDVQSIERKGTTVTLYFPATRKDLDQERMALAEESYKGIGESILVIDDIREQREIAQKILTQLGYTVETVASGEAAVDYLKDHSVDLLVLDMIMDPGLDGLDTYQKIIEMHPLQKAIIASGYSETDRVRRTQELGAGTYVKKPYTLEKIGMAVRLELDKK